MYDSSPADHLLVPSELDAERSTRKNAETECQITDRGIEFRNSQPDPGPWTSAEGSRQTREYLGRSKELSTGA